MTSEQVRNDRLKEEEDERRMRAQMRRKEISAKEASAVLRTIVAEVTDAEIKVCAALLC
jgi:predicted ATP-binding protein involved in virulence